MTVNELELELGYLLASKDCKYGTQQVKIQRYTSLGKGTVHSVII